jgi:hypothetical protein
MLMPHSWSPNRFGAATLSGILEMSWLFPSHFTFKLSSPSSWFDGQTVPRDSAVLLDQSQLKQRIQLFEIPQQILIAVKINVIFWIIIPRGLLPPPSVGNNITDNSVRIVSVV